MNNNHENKINEDIINSLTKEALEQNKNLHNTLGLLLKAHYGIDNNEDGEEVIHELIRIKKQHTQQKRSIHYFFTLATGFALGFLFNNIIRHMYYYNQDIESLP